MRNIQLVNTMFVFLALYFGSAILFNGSSSQFGQVTTAHACAVADASAVKSVATREENALSAFETTEQSDQQDLALGAENFNKGDLRGRFSNISSATYPGANGKTLFANCVGLVTFDGTADLLTAKRTATTA